MSDKAASAVNQQGSPSKADPPETTRRSPIRQREINAYFQGALHDASLNKGKRFRFAQKSEKWLRYLAHLLKNLGYNSWIYREGKNRHVFILETLADFLDFKFDPMQLHTEVEQVAYIRGFFDAEGGIPHAPEARFYIQLVQKNRYKLEKIKDILFGLGITCGKIHNPSKKVDPAYWRFFILSKSREDFVRKIGSWHPIKTKLLSDRVMI